MQGGVVEVSGGGITVPKRIGMRMWMQHRTHPRDTEHEATLLPLNVIDFVAAAVKTNHHHDATK